MRGSTNFSLETTSENFALTERPYLNYFCLTLGSVTLEDALPSLVLTPSIDSTHISYSVAQEPYGEGDRYPLTGSFRAAVEATFAANPKLTRERDDLVAHWRHLARAERSHIMRDNATRGYFKPYIERHPEVFGSVPPA